MTVARTPDDAFADLPDFPFEPRYVEVGDGLRMHYVDAGPRDKPPVLLLHGQPTWSYLYRHVIAHLVEAGLRAVAPDLIGFGRSDKPTARTAYTMKRHVRWLSELVSSLDLRDITLVGQDWGGPLGLAALTNDPERYRRIVVSNTILHTAEPSLAGRLDWAVHGIEGETRVVIEEPLLDYLIGSQRYALVPSMLVSGATVREVAPEVLAAYDAPFPDESFRGGLRQLPMLVPLTRTDPGAAINRRTTEFLRAWERPLLTAYGDGDPATRGWAEVFRDLVPGAAGQPHVTIDGAGHFIQEDKPAELAGAIAGFVDRTTM